MDQFQRNEQIINGTLDDNLVMLHIEKGKYYGLNPVGRRIWELLEQPKSAEQLVQALLEEYEVAEQQCRDEVAAFLNSALDSGIIVRYG
jgi:hypothetical protein